MPRKFSNISRRDGKKRNPPPPAPTVNQRNVSTNSNGSMMGNMAGGMRIMYQKQIYLTVIKMVVKFFQK